MTTSIPAGVPYTARSSWTAYDGGPAADASGITITIIRMSDLVTILAATSTGIVHVTTGLYAYQWTPASDASGDFTIIWRTGDNHQASETVTVGAPSTTVTVDDVVEYMGADVASHYAVEVGDVTTYPEIADALATETVVQRKRCTYPVPTTANPNPDVSDLTQALKRRVVRNLAMRPLPLSMEINVDAGTITRPMGRDPEIRRLEEANRKLTAG